MGPAVFGILVVAGLTMILRLAVTGRITHFSPRRARLRTASLRSSNATLMLSAASLAALAVTISADGAQREAVSGAVGPSLAVW